MEPAGMVTVATMAAATLEGTPEAEMPAGPTVVELQAVETAAAAGMGEARGDQAVEYSALQGWLDEGGITLKVVIYRVPSIDARWQLEVVDHQGRATCWSERFKTDREALEAFEDCLDTEGVCWFVRPETRH